MTVPLPRSLPRSLPLVGLPLLILALAGCGDSTSPSDAGVLADVPPDQQGDAVVASGCDGLPAEDLCFLREEEKLARDVYQALFEQNGISAFENIAMSEQTHTDAVRDLLNARSIPDPVRDDTRGVFVNSTLGGLYTSLVADGRMSELDALAVGATVEDLDIHDIRTMVARTPEGDVDALALYANLECGSRNHMRSFVSLITARGETYQPQFINQEEFDTIIGGERERCGGGR